MPLSWPKSRLPMAKASLPISFVCGLKSEAACLDGIVPAEAVAISGASAERALDMSRAFVSQGAKGLISFGVSGSLCSTLTPGTLVIAEGVKSDHQSHWWPHEPWIAQAKKLAEEINFDCRSVVMYGSRTIIENPEQKQALQKETGALAVDMETHAVALAASEANLPFFAIRSIADGAEQVIPKAALNGVAEDGSVRPLAVLSQLASRPSDLPALVTLGRQSRLANEALRRCALEFLPIFLERCV